MEAAYRDAALRHLDLRFARLESLLRTDDDAAELAAAQARAISATETEAEEAGIELPLVWLRRRTGMPPLAEDCLLLAVAAQVRPGLAKLIAQHPAAGGFAHVSPELCLSVLLPDRIDRLSQLPLFLPGSGLLRHRLVRLLPIPDAIGNVLRGTLLPSPVITALLLGVESMPDILEGVAVRVRPEVALDDLVLAAEVRDHADAALGRLVGGDDLDRGRHGPGGFNSPVSYFELITGHEGSGRRLLVAALARAAGRAIVRVDGRALSVRPTAQREACLDLAFQIAWLRGDWLLLTDADAVLDEADLAAHFARLADELPITGALTAASAGALSTEVRQRIGGQVELPRLDHHQMEQVWQRHAPADIEVDWRRLVERHPLPPTGVRNAVRSARRSGAVDAAGLMRAAAALDQVSADAHALKLPAQKRLDDIFVDDELAEELERIVGIARTRHRAIREWGLASRIHRGLGLVCLFEGESGTGKTLAAEVIASEVALPLMRVNLATVVSKYIGETAKNLRDVFERAARSPCVLLFDEADSLFAKRTEVSRSTDRYANMDVNLLLQLTEDHDGIVILTTNLVASIDKAFRRRINFNLRFEMPDAATRERIWRRLMPPGVPQESLDFAAFAQRHELAGGAIKSVIVRAVFEAARLDQPVTEAMIEQSMLRELSAQGKVVRSS